MTLMKVINSSLLILMLGLSLQTSLAASGGSLDGGGGHRMGADFFDQWLRENLFDPTQDPAFIEIVEPTLLLIESWVPVFGGNLRAVLKDKDWYTVVPREIITAKQAGILFTAEEVAYQTREEVYFDGKWLAAADPQNRATGYLHELLQGARVMNGVDKIKPENVWRLTIRLLSNKYNNAEELKRALDSMGFPNWYKTEDQIEREQRETDEVRNLVGGYEERLKAICLKHSSAADYRYSGMGTAEMKEVVRDLLIRTGFYSAEELVQAGLPDLSTQYTESFKAQLRTLFSYRVLGVLNNFRYTAQAFELDSINLMSGAEIRIKTCNALGVRIRF